MKKIIDFGGHGEVRSGEFSNSLLQVIGGRGRCFRAGGARYGNESTNDTLGFRGPSTLPELKIRDS